MKAVYTRTRIAGAEDVMVTTHDLWHEDEDWTDAQMDDAMEVLSNFWDDIRNQVIAPGVRLEEIRAYKGYDGDGSPGHVDRIFIDTRTGDADPPMCPPQVACSVTELTDDRRHWGRFYIPGISAGVLASDGTLQNTAIEVIANAARNRYEDWPALDGEPVPIVWSRSGAPMSFLLAAPPRWLPSYLVPSGGAEWTTPAAVAVQAIRVDEVLDVQRSRRYQDTQIRETRQLGA